MHLSELEFRLQKALSLMVRMEYLQIELYLKLKANFHQLDLLLKLEV
jgi:hypothetical protein